MVREGDAGQFEWVNSWAETNKPAEETAQPVSAAPPVARSAELALQPVAATPVAPTPPDQLMIYLADIERRRDALAALPVAVGVSGKRTQAFTLVPSRTTDAVPVLIGGVFALVLLTVFGAAAAMTKFAR